MNGDSKTYPSEQPEIMRGTLSDMTIEPTGRVGSCPSLSPDSKTLVFKEMRQDGTFELVAVDVATNTRQKLGETRSVDDQVEWLDNDPILYEYIPKVGPPRYNLCSTSGSLKSPMVPSRCCSCQMPILLRRLVDCCRTGQTV